MVESPRRRHADAAIYDTQFYTGKGDVTMWSTIDIDDVAGLEQFMAITRQLDKRYRYAPLSVVTNALRVNQGEAWHYQSGDVEISMLLQYSDRRGHWQVSNVGFTGTIAPAAALDLVVAKLGERLTAHGASSAFTVCPKTVDNASIQEFYDLVAGHPNLNVTVRLTTEKAFLWEVGYLAA